MDKTLADLLRQKKACGDALEWVGSRDAKTAWDTCSRSDWMVWLLEEFSVLDALMWESLAGEMAATLKTAEPGIYRKIVQTVNLWKAGHADLEHLKTACRAATYACHPQPDLYPQQADAIRRVVPWEIVEKALNSAGEDQ